MDWIQAVVLALIQGVTEFLPVSSSGHLVLPQALLGWADQGLAFDVAVHVGSLAAVLWYFRQDVRRLLLAWGQHVSGGQLSTDGRLAWMVIVATVPAVIGGLLLNDLIEAKLRTAAVLATTTLVFGVLLGAVDYWARPTLSCRDIGLRQALFIGLAQTLALVPGTSRSGITMTAGLMLGLTRSESARFSFLLSMPIIAAAGSYKLLELLQQQAPVQWGLIGIGTAVSGITAYLCIHLFLGWVERIGMMPFAIYRVLLGLILFWLVV